MRTILMLTVLAGLALAGPTGKTENADMSGLEAYLVSFPASPTADPDPVQVYELTYSFHLRDVDGAPQTRTAVTGRYTRDTENGRFRWNDVSIAGAGADGELPEPTPLTIMEDFEYGLSAEIAEESLYERFPKSDLKDLIKTMVWDGMMIELVDMSLNETDSLPLHEFSLVGSWEDVDVQMADWGKLTMKDLRVKWSGVTVMHGEPCAVAFYMSFANPVDADPARGRSCYWGQFWVSLVDREIECLTLNEDVVLEVAMLGDFKRILNFQREVEFEKHPQAGR
ncbi:MAG: hypothetical protein GF405_01795 [Candidatus Eisenbacteria bacterium]|nr:hypothetical protein [Candidatus Eisenbacteria bacterium]